MIVKDYRMSKTCEAFHNDDSFVRCLIGPFASGKSVAMVMEMLMKSYEQAPNRSGVRNTRWIIVRNTYRELVDTTMKTFFQWVNIRWGRYLAKDMSFVLSIPYRDQEGKRDGTMVHAEFLFRAFDKVSDIGKLLSMELTGGFINETREVPRAVLSALAGRVGRYPETGASWSGVIADSNPDDNDSWLYKLFEVDRPEGYRLFKQPSGLAPEAENLENLLQPPEQEREGMTMEDRRECGRRYYTRMAAGKTQEWINVYIHGKWGLVSDGKPVFPEYNDDIHSTDEDYVPLPANPIYVGIDFGLTPAAVFIQKAPSGRLVCFDELVCEDMGAESFSKLLNQMINERYRGFIINCTGDPAGDFRAQTDETTPFQVMFANGINAVPAYTNDFVVRREAVVYSMTRLDFSGKPAFVVTPGAPMLRKGLGGGYCMKRMAVSGQERFKDTPDKNNKYSHVCDALQYACLGAGFGGLLIDSEGYSKKIDYSEIDRMVV